MSLRRCGVSSDVVRHLIKRYCKFFDWETEELREELQWREVEFFLIYNANQYLHGIVCEHVEDMVDCRDALMNSGTLVKEGKSWRRITHDIELIIDVKYWDSVYFPSLKRHLPDN